MSTYFLLNMYEKVYSGKNGVSINIFPRIWLLKNITPDKIIWLCNEFFVP